jgi:hypothetical protein
LDSAVQSGKFVPSGDKIFREEFTVNIVEKYNPRGKRQAGISEFKDGVFSVPE